MFSSRVFPKKTTKYLRGFGNPTNFLNHGNKTEMGIIIGSWVKHNNLEDMSDLLIYDLNDSTPGGTLCCYKETAEAEETKFMPNTP